MQINNVTLILILHNRHRNIDRLLDYYTNESFPILIADSSKKQHHFAVTKPNWQHLYLPRTTFTQKIEIALQLVKTPFVAMCADDDFIIPASLFECVRFLENNELYTVAQGRAIRYDKSSVSAEKIRFRLLYNETHNVEEEYALQRLYRMFKPYRSLLYAVFKTVTLQKTFAGAGNVVKHLYLNEYLTAFLPIVLGKYAELPILYQVREYAEDSDDKTAVNLDSMMHNPSYRLDIGLFEHFVTAQTAAALAKPDTELAPAIHTILEQFAEQLAANRQQKTSWKKQIGKLVSIIPLAGKHIVERNRAAETKAQLQTVVRTQNDKAALDHISGILKKYQELA